MKINLTKLLYLCYDNTYRVIKVNDPTGTTGDTSYIPRDQSASNDEAYSFPLENTAEGG